MPTHSRVSNLAIACLITTTLILSGIQAMLPALGLDWYDQSMEENLENVTPESEYTAPADQEMFDIEIPTGYDKYSNSPSDYVIDSNDKMHVVFHDAYDADADGNWCFKQVYATKESGGSWNFENVTTNNGDIGCWDESTTLGYSVISLALDDLNQPHIVFIADDDIMHSQKTGGVWSEQTIERVGENSPQGDPISAKIAYMNNELVVAYSGTGEDSDPDFLKFATKLNDDEHDGWDIETVSTNEITVVSSLKSDSLGTPHIIGSAVAAIAADDIYYYNKEGGSWESQLFSDLGGDWQGTISMDIDSSDNIHVLWSKGTWDDKDLMDSVYWNNNNTWTNTTILSDASFLLSHGMFLKIDSNDRSHIIFSYEGDRFVGFKKDNMCIGNDCWKTNRDQDSNLVIGFQYPKIILKDGITHVVAKSATFEILILQNNDEDGFLNDDDDCKWTYGTSYLELDGCLDTDNDGYGDATSEWSANDGADSCENTWGESWRDRYGCSDQDYDGQSDLNDAFWQESTQWFDADGDMLGDNWADGSINSTRPGYWPGEWVEDAWLSDPSPLDWDQDGYEDDWLDDSIPPYDDCPYVYGYSSTDQYGCSDADQDGYSDSGDAFPGDSSEYEDTDGDGYGDNEDAFPNDASEWGDSDGDGTGDNSDDAPYDDTETSDTDGDGVGDGSDAFPNDASESEDSDGDGTGDNSDQFPYDADETQDSDWDGVGDNADAFPYDGSEQFDTDEDGIGDNEDQFPYDPDEWMDEDGDGVGDNTDAFPYDNWEWADSDNDTYGDNLDSCPYEAGNTSGQWGNFGCPDADGDGWADDDDAFPNDETQDFDWDNDGYGDNWSGNNPDSCPTMPGTSTWIDDGSGEPVTGYGCPDSDEDDYANNIDSCQSISGTSTVDRYGCPDDDNDGISNSHDPYPYNATSDPTDWDGDGYPDHADTEDLNTDDFPADNTQNTDSDGDGFGDNASGNNPDAFPSDPNEWVDTDGDGVGDNTDDCIYSAGNSTEDWVEGCPDDDGDGWSNDDDAFDDDATQWSDWDGDGYGDHQSGTTPDQCQNQAGSSTLRVVGYFGGGGFDGGWDADPGENETWYGCPDEDSDAYEDQTDPCPYQYGTSWVDRFACLDTDLDGISDQNDPYPNTATSDVTDWDGDGYPDHDSNNSNNTDAFPEDSSQWSDGDDDGYGDNPNGTDPDAFPNDPNEWSDQDSDGIGDNMDDCVNSAGNSTEWINGCPDADGDGYADSDDDFPSDATQFEDWDNDGYGDNFSGTTPDQCPNQAGTSTLREWNGANQTWYGCPDSDSDGYEDGSDPCPYSFGNSWVDRFACPDTDQDGISDANDPYPQTPTADPEDWDGDGYLDNSENESNNTDAFPGDSSQWSDADGDGYGDNPNGTNPDAFPSDPGEWLDNDGDGVGDNTDGCVNSAGNSTEGSAGCPDADGDGYADSDDDFPSDATQFVDWDNDGYGDNSSGTTPDSCPNQAGTSTLRVWNWANETWYGCPDSDSDGYEDGSDPCPYSFGNSWVDRFACLDTDQDGISDANDPYPQTPTADPEDWDGDGYLDNSENESNNTDAFPGDSSQWSDADGDGYGDNGEGTTPDAFPSDPTEWSDADGDGVGDNTDGCVNSAGTSTEGSAGCPDADGDGYSDDDDEFDSDATQWEDYDSDGYGDNMSGTNPDSCIGQPGTSTLRVWNWANETWHGCPDNDSDGYEDNTDPCPYSFGNSWVDRFACLDTDQDGISDANDPYPQTPTADPEDWDGDGYLDNSENESNNTDAFPGDSSQWSDADGDGYGDNPNGTNPDAFPSDPGEWHDNDGDGVGNYGDHCPNTAGNSTLDLIGCPDSDGDGHADEMDDFPTDPTQFEDFDGDGYGNNASGTTPDSCLLQPGTSTLRVFNGENQTRYGCPDSDSDGYEDNTDPCEFSYGNSWVDRFACPDTDQDGISDGYDPYPNSATTDVEDWDGDGALDHAANSSFNTDAFPADATQWSDSDMDGYGDNPNGSDADAFPDDQDEWLDTDSDGFGDNSDSCKYEAGNSTRLPKGCPDSDGDGYANSVDDFEDDATSWSDVDGDGYADNAGAATPDSCPSQQGTSTMTVASGQNMSYYGCTDTDGDGYVDSTDPCPNQFGNSWVDTMGCSDVDQDGISDLHDPQPNTATLNIADWDGDGALDHSPNASNNIDAFPEDASQWGDADGDGYGDNPNGTDADAFPNEGTQWSDRDGDGFGDNDNSGAHQPDACPFTAGNSSEGMLGCVDDDGDGWSNEEDDFSDDRSQWSDYDNDGFGDNPNGTDADDCLNQGGSSLYGVDSNGTMFDLLGCIDSDSDGFADTSDPCPFLFGNSWADRYACPDSDIDGISDFNDPYPLTATNDSADWDGDGVSDHDENSSRNGDAFPDDMSQWSDADGDGYGDNSAGNDADSFPDDSTQWEDSDRDGFGDEEQGNEADDCPFENGNSTEDRLGCSDTDGDGYSDASSGWMAHPYGEADSHPVDPTQWEDRDNDGYGDNPDGRDADEFPDDSAEWVDTDDDGIGDNNDDCADEFGTSSAILLGCPDGDGDGYSDEMDLFPNESSQWSDVDYDLHGDNTSEGAVDPDYFPFIPGQWIDEDGDGFGDNPSGPFADVFPKDITQWTDYDGDGCGDNQQGDNPDRFQNDPTQCEDADGDGKGDNQNGRDPDMFPAVASQWSDVDGDGLGDNISEGAELADICNDAQSGELKSCIYDRDNDGVDDLVDMFPDEPTQWKDDDEDGKGDNRFGYNGDPYPGDRDNDGYRDPTDEEDLGERDFTDMETGEVRTCLKLDISKWLIEDAFPDNPTEWSDWDGDCLGDNVDPDDDNDGSSDMEELVAGTSVFAAGETPWSGVWVPGVNVELGAWDLIGILVGVPSIIYLAIAFMTRNGRAARFEEELLECTDVIALERISEAYEKALMMRMLGPHQGLFLERVRSRVEVQLETRGGASGQSSRKRAADIVAEAAEETEKRIRKGGNEAEDATT